MWKKMRHLANEQYNARVLPVARRVYARVNRRKIKAEIQMLENLWEGKITSDLSVASRRLDSLVQWLVCLKRLSTPVDFFFPGTRSEAEAEKHKKEMMALEALWPTNDNHMFEEHLRRGNEYREPYEEAKVPIERQEPVPSSWVIPHDFHTRATGGENLVKVTNDLDTWEVNRRLQRKVRARLGRS